jgi:hypothetical protein
MANKIDQKIEARILSFVDDLTSLVHDAVSDAVSDAVRSAISSTRGGGGGGGGGGRGGRPARAASSDGRGPGTGKKRTSEQVDAMGSRLLAEIKRGGGRRIEQIAASMRVKTSVLKLPVIKLMAEKKIKTTGTRRGTKYFAR